MSNNKPDPRGGPSAHGAEVGKALAKISAEGRRLAAEHGIEIPEQCLSCAFREGSMPNQSAATVRDAMSSVADSLHNAFHCHHGLDEAGQPTRKCYGFIAAVAAGDVFLDVLEKVKIPHYPEGEDPVRADYEAWLAIADPEDQMDDYQRAALYARREKAQ